MFQQAFDLLSGSGLAISGEMQNNDVYLVRVTCHGQTILEHGIIKCDCETEDELREYAASIVLEKLSERGLYSVLEECKEKGRVSAADQVS